MINSKTLQAHAIGVLLLVTYEVILVYISGSRPALIDFVPYYIVSLLFFILSIFLFFKLKGFGILVSFITAASLILGFTLHTFLNLWLDHIQLNKQFNRFTGHDYALKVARSSFILLLALGYWIGLRSYNNAKKAKEEEIRRIKSEQRQTQLENAYLQAQVNPHMLLNALNLLHNTVGSVSDKASEVLILLIDIMRYTYAPLDKDGKSSLLSELDQVKRYIKLNELRLEKQFSFKYHEIISKATALRIPPLLLLTLVENMFKHGKFNDPMFPGRLDVVYDLGKLHFHLENAKSLYKSGESYQVGIENTKARLHSFYEDKFDFIIKNSQDYFVLDLAIEM